MPLIGSQRIQRRNRRLSGMLWVVVTAMFCSCLIISNNIQGQRIHGHKVIAQSEAIKGLKTETSVLRPKVSAHVKHDFADHFAELDKALPKSEQVTPSLLIAQAALESDWGQNVLYKDADNPFSVKGAYNGNYMTYPTDEVSSKGNTYSEMSDFRQYPSLEDAVRDHNILLKQKFLQGSQNNDYVSEAKAIQNNGYATDPNYAQKLMGYVQEYNLTRFD